MTDTTPAPIGEDALREALWICVEHNALHFGETHNTVVQGRAALAGAAPAAQGEQRFQLRLHNTMNTYTVVLLYPDYITNNYGQEHYFWEGEAESPTDAARKAQQFLASEHNSDGATSEPEDFYVVAVIEGRPPMFFPE